jgi:hypothetical protein
VSLEFWIVCLFGIDVLSLVAVEIDDKILGAFSSVVVNAEFLSHCLALYNKETGKKNKQVGIV